MICIVPLLCLSVYTLTLLILFPIKTLLFRVQLPFSHQQLHSLLVSLPCTLTRLTPTHSPPPHLPVSSSFTQSLFPGPPILLHLLCDTRTHGSIQPAQPPTQSRSAWIEVKNCHASSNVRRPFWIYDCALNVEAFEWVAAECSVCTWMNGSQADQTCHRDDSITGQQRTWAPVSVKLIQPLQPVGHCV